MQAPDSPEGELNHEFARMLRAMHLMRELAAQWLPAGVDPAAAQLLMLLVKNGPSRQSELAEQTFFDPSTVSRRVGQLVAHGLVERQADPADGRAVRLAATSSGVTLVERVRDARDAITRGVLGEWPDQDVHTLTRLLSRYNDAIDSYRRNVTNHSHAEPQRTGAS